MSSWFKSSSSATVASNGTNSDNSEDEKEEDLENDNADADDNDDDDDNDEVYESHPGYRRRADEGATFTASKCPNDSGLKNSCELPFGVIWTPILS